MSDQKGEQGIDALLKVMIALRTPETGCPWDIEQTFESIAPYTIEEAYEVADAISRGDRHDLKDELGDLLLQVVYHARMAEEEGSFDFTAVTRSITEKMIRRHPHVFKDDKVTSSAAMSVKWEDIKAQERALKAKERGAVTNASPPSVLDDVPIALPALTRAHKLQKKASRVGFDWSDVRDVFAKVQEEVDEVQEALTQRDKEHIREEIGDLLFAVTNLARHVEVDAEQALKDANQKFTARFTYIERELTSAGRQIEKTSPEEMDKLWNEAKRKPAT